MRSRLLLPALTLYFAFALGCSKAPAPASATPADANANPATDVQAAPGEGGNGPSTEARERREPKRDPLVLRAGTPITIRLDSSIGSKLSQAGQTFTGSVAKDIVVRNAVAIPQGATVAGTVTDAKPLGKFAGGAVLQVRLDSINLNGSDMPVRAALRTFSEKGKGKRTAVLTGGGAALGGIIGALAGGGKGAAIGMAAGAGAGAGGSAFTGNKEIVLPAESVLTFELSEPLELRN